MARMVQFVKFGRELPGLEKPPMPGELGQRIYENVSQRGWQLWMEQLTILINHYGLNMADPRAHEFIAQQMEEFFFGEGAQMPEDWLPEDQAPSGKGGPGPSGKGAPAPRSK
ncbi:MAG: oxidative damage protection protein [Candidatus Promineifilaceae bacterium]|nr:oxidative damage protection protein [Candidatus Promineifilaceae bacterium]